MSDSTPPLRGNLTQYRLSNVETKIATIEEEFPKTYATKEQHNDLKRIVYGVFGTAGGAIAIIFANSFHLFAR